MRRMGWFGFLLVVVVAVCAARGDDVVPPPQVTFTNNRTDTASLFIDGTYFWGTSVTLTNCLTMFSGSVTQGLDGVDVEVRVGTLSTNVPYAATVASTNEGLYWVTISVPSNANTQIQTKLTDSQTNVYIYQTKTMRTAQPMQ